MLLVLRPSSIVTDRWGTIQECDGVVRWSAGFAWRSSYPPTGTATGISAGGLTIGGSGYNPAGVQEAWMAHVPEPSTLVLIALGAWLPAQHRRRRGHAQTRPSP
ncbi:MAG: PEP-CTERM sorting domain-containing protein [bacterium]|nr:PEP-CTERM sorting domain-containing protein [bacterium]